MRLIPKRTIQDETGEVLFYRWRLLKLGKTELYLHHYMKSDSARGLHDHPWKWAVALPLYPGYTEHRAQGQALQPYSPVVVRFRKRTPASLYRLGITDFHRIELDKGPSWSLFLAGPRVKQWGFLYPDGRYELHPDDPGRWA